MDTMYAEITVLSGGFADAGQLTDADHATVRFMSGPHAGHKAEISTAKHDCGAFEESVVCACGAHYQNEMNGCWQRGHQRQERGDATLRFWYPA